MESRFVYPKPAKKTAGEQAKDWAIYFIVMGIIFVVLDAIFKAITWPFRMVLRTDRQRFQDRVDQQKSKIFKRTELRRAYDNSESNPLFQYLERFKLNPDNYIGDPNNEVYNQWFEKMKEG